MWLAECTALRRALRAGTKRQVVVAVANALKRLKAEELPDTGFAVVLRQSP